MRSNRATIVTPDSIEKHLAFLSATGLSSNTLRAYRADLNQYLLWKMQVEEMPQDLEQQEFLLMQWLSDGIETKSPATTKRRVASSKRWLKWAGLRGALDEFRAPPLEPRKPHPVPRLDEGLRDLVDYTDGLNNHYATALVVCGGWLGCRVSESRALEPDDFDTDAWQVRIQGKGRKVRYVPLTEETWTRVQPAVSIARVEGGPIVPLADRTARLAITAAGQAIGMGSISSHDLRSTFATMAWANSKDLLVVARLMGHSDPKTTEPYIAIDEQLWRKAVAF